MSFFDPGLPIRHWTGRPSNSETRKPRLRARNSKSYGPSYPCGHSLSTRHVRLSSHSATVGFLFGRRRNYEHDRRRRHTIHRRLLRTPFDLRSERCTARSRMARKLGGRDYRRSEGALLSRQFAFGVASMKPEQCTFSAQAGVDGWRCSEKVTLLALILSLCSCPSVHPVHPRAGVEGANGRRSESPKPDGRAVGASPGRWARASRSAA